ncbi:hypothetical protein [Roseibium album]|uniref:hypothetical protein n=1 Tax=Roseibium album TaxID=311410 RepID=UPI003BAEB36B
MSGGSKTKTQTQTQTTKNEPYAAAKPLYNQAMGDAHKLYNEGNLIKPNTMSTVVPYAEQTVKGMDALESQANKNLAPGGFADQMQQTVDRGGFTGTQQQAVDQLNPFTTGEKNVDTSGFEAMSRGGLGVSSGLQQNLYGQSQSPTYSEQNLSDVASGKKLGGGDPYFEDVLNRASEEARFAADRTAGAMGRYGSDDHFGAMASDIMGIQTQARSNQYQQERAAQERVNQMLDSSRLSNLGFGLNAANSATGIEQGNRQMQAAGLTNLANTDAGNLSRQMQGISQQFNAGQTGFGNMSSALDAMQQPADMLRGVGGAYEDLATRELNDELRISQEKQNAPLSNLQALLAVAGGAGGYGTSQSTAQVPYQQQNNGLSNTIGAGLGAASLFGGFF